MTRPLGSENRNTVPATHQPRIRDLAWAAGFLEGEGSFRLNGNSQRVSAVQVNLEPLFELVQLFGGIVQENRLKDVRDRQPIGEWRVSGARARGVMFTLYPFLSAKRQRQIKKALLLP